MDSSACAEDFLFSICLAAHKIYKEVYHFMAKVELKKPVVAEISENIKDAESVILVQYCGITVEADSGSILWYYSGG